MAPMASGLVMNAIRRAEAVDTRCQCRRGGGINAARHSSAAGVRKFEWTNPRFWLFVTVPAAESADVTYGSELSRACRRSA
jgi:hypothetical protein